MNSIQVSGARIDFQTSETGLLYATSPDERGLFMAFKADEPIDCDEIRTVIFVLRVLNARPRWMPLWLTNRWIDLRLRWSRSG